MSEKKIGGFIFRTFKNDHYPYHVHVFGNSGFLGRFDMVNKRSLDERLKITGQLRKALKQAGYLK